MNQRTAKLLKKASGPGTNHRQTRKVWEGMRESDRAIVRHSAQVSLIAHEITEDAKCETTRKLIREIGG